MSRIRTAGSVLRHYGLRWVVYRLRVALLHRVRWEERQMPMAEWPDVEESTWTGLFPKVSPQAVADFRGRYPEAVQACLEEAEEILSGRFRRFEGPCESLGFPPRWHEEMPGRSLPGRGTHWSRIQPLEDIKLAWELSRMGWAQVLGRAYGFTGEERFAEAFWTLLEDWYTQNPPNQGPQWMCGQEASLRAYSLTLAADRLRGAKATSPRRVGLLLNILQATGKRVEPHIHYARSQRNNHALNEALGLLTAGMLLPSVEAASRWVEMGSSLFESDILDQLDEEGSYIQHSTNYHRVMLHACLWRLCLARVQGQPLAPGLLARMEAGLRWMIALVDPITGEAPNLGSNDGANVLRLASGGYGDQRPALQALAAMLGLPLPFPQGPWDESVLWLFGEVPQHLRREPPPREAFSAPARGHFIRRNEDSSLYFRCASYRERPSQSDPLHVDLTWRGLNLLCDAGTYRYNAAAPWNNSLAFTGVHNTVTLEGRPSMGRVGPFLWVDWDRCRLGSAPEAESLVGHHLATATFPMRHTRSIRALGPRHWVIVDDALAEAPSRFRIHWLLPLHPHTLLADGIQLATSQGEFQLSVLGPGSLELRSGDPAEGTSTLGPGPTGWRSPCYFQREPALSLSRVGPPSPRARWVSIAGEGPFQAALGPEGLLLQTPSDRFQIELPPPPFSER